MAANREIATRWQGSGMSDLNTRAQSSQLTPTGDSEAIRHLEQAIAGGKHWYIALLETIGLWAKVEEAHNRRSYCYLIAGEAFDWLLLAERLCQSVDGLLPDDEKTAFLFYGKPPLNLTTDKFKELIGSSKYHQYLNYFYGITVEEALLLEVQEEVHKERLMSSRRDAHDTADEAYQRIYGVARDVLLKQFRQERGRPQLETISLTELKEFTYWLFKYRVEQCEKAKVASDTRKALEYLKRQWARKGFCGTLVTDDSFAE